MVSCFSVWFTLKLYTVYFSIRAVDVQGETTASFTQQASTASQYLYQEGMPSLTEFSLCFWFEGDAANDDDNWVTDIIFNMATGMSRYTSNK